MKRSMVSGEMIRQSWERSDNAWVLGSLLWVALCSPGRAADPVSLSQDDVVVFLGGTNMVRLQRAGHLETMLTAAHAEAPPRFRDLSWEADTVFQQGSVIERWRKDGFGARDAQLKRVGATVIVAQFGLSLIHI